MTKTLPFLLVLSLLTCCVEIDISVPSFPDISDHFDISDGLTQMTIAVNFLGFCISSVICGPLSDSYGRRKVMIIGNGVMLIGAALCVIANNIETLLVARFIQGLGASTSAVVAFAMGSDSYKSAEATKIIGFMNSLITVFSSAAPIVGSFINQLAGFRGNYLTIALLSLISWMLLYFKLPETKKDKSTLNMKSIVKNFYMLITDKTFLYASIVPSITFSGYMSFIACAPFLYIETYNLSITYYAINQGIIIGVFSIFSMYSGRISSFLEKKNCVIYGTVLFFIAGIFGLFTGFVFPNSPFFTTCFMVIFAIGAAITYPIIFTKSLEIFPEIKGIASSAIMGSRALLVAGFVAFTSYIYDGTLLNVALGIVISSGIATYFTVKLVKLMKF